MNPTTPPLTPRLDLSILLGLACLALSSQAVPVKAEVFPEMQSLWNKEPAGISLAEHTPETGLFRQAERNARLANQALFRCRRYVAGWLAHADPSTGLIPRGIRSTTDFWNGRDAGADNYAFMVLTAALTDRPLLEGRMLEMLRTETRLTSRLGRLPDDYSFTRKGWRRETLNRDEIIFDGAEYVKDGLLPITEWLGRSPWSERMTGIIEDIWKEAVIDTPFGQIPTLNFEVNGDLLQANSRLFWLTGERKYLDWAVRLGDYYLLGTNHPTRHRRELRLRDHGCEVVNGLTELYVAVKHTLPDKAAAYQKPLHELFGRILEAGRNEHGMLYDWFNPQTGDHSKGICDTWGYNFDGFYTLYLLDNKASYREAVRKALSHLQAHYQNYAWEGASSDGYADSIEGAINLINREPIASAAEWIDSEMRVMWSKQQADGVIEGWHGDGNFARTSLMYALWKSQGVTLQPWRADLRFGAALGSGGRLCLSMTADQPWEGRVFFDRPRHQETMHLPLDYPRINQFPEWFTVKASEQYRLFLSPASRPVIRQGSELAAGLPLQLKGGEEARWIIDQ